MGILNNIIGSMNRNEARHFMLFANRTNATASRKDITLFNYIRKSGQGYEEDKVLKKLYKDEDKNAFYRLKNRLLEDLCKSIAIQYFTAQDTNQVLNYIALAKLYMGKGQLKVVNYFLKKAERKASEIQSFELLDIIYSDFIRLSHETLSINPEKYIQARKENRIQLNRLQEIDDILAVLIYRIKRSQNLASKNNQFTDLLQKTIADFSENANIQENPQFRFKIYHAVSRILLQKQDYPALEEYLLETLRQFERENLFKRSNHETRLQMITYLINALFANNKLSESYEYIQELKAAMIEHNNLLHDKYLIYYYNALAAYYNATDQEQAIEVLKEAIDSTAIRKYAESSLAPLILNLALTYYYNGSMKLASKTMVKLKLDDSFQNVDQGFKLKIALAEMMIRYDLNDFDFIEYQADRVHKDFSNLLERPEYGRQLEMLEVLSGMIFTPAMRNDEALMARVNKIINESPTAEGFARQDVLGYKEWLEAKLG